MASTLDAIASNHIPLAPSIDGRFVDKYGVYRPMSSVFVEPIEEEEDEDFIERMPGPSSPTTSPGFIIRQVDAPAQAWRTSSDCDVDPYELEREMGRSFKRRRIWVDVRFPDVWVHILPHILNQPDIIGGLSLVCREWNKNLKDVMKPVARELYELYAEKISSEKNVVLTPKMLDKWWEEGDDSATRSMNFVRVLSKVEEFSASDAKPISPTDKSFNAKRTRSSSDNESQPGVPRQSGGSGRRVMRRPLPGRALRGRALSDPTR